jgi:hypothetical protein
MLRTVQVFERIVFPLVIPAKAGTGFLILISPQANRRAELDSRLRWNDEQNKAATAK